MANQGQIVELQSAKLSRFYKDLSNNPFVMVVLHDMDFTVYFTGLTEVQAMDTIQELLVARTKESNGSEEG